MLRKFIRNRMRKEAEIGGFNAARYVRNAFEQFQIKKYGERTRLINKAKGTSKRKLWRQRISVLCNAEA